MFIISKLLVQLKTYIQTDSMSPKSSITLSIYLLLHFNVDFSTAININF